MLDRPDRHLPLDGTHNVRDLGGYRTNSGSLTRWRSLLRADALHRLTDAGREELLAAGLRTVVDLRFEAEKKEAPQPFCGDPRVVVRDISLFARLNTAGLHAGDEGDLLAALYRMALASCRGEIGAVLTAIAEADSGMVLFHCTAGKDRTGIVAALLLLLADVPADTIAADYALTATLGARLHDELLRHMVARGQPEAEAKRYLAARRETMHDTMGYLAAEYGGIDGYLGGVLSSDRSSRLRARLVA